MNLNNLSYHMTNATRYLTISVLVLTVSAVMQPPVRANGNFEVEKEGELITIQSSNASLIAVADRLSEVIDVPITYTDGNDVAVTLNIVEEPIEQVVEKLSKNSMIVRKSVGGEDVISEIVVLLEGEAGSGGVTANLPSGEPAEGIIAGQEPIDQTEPTMDAALPAEFIINDQGVAVPVEQSAVDPLIDGSGPIEPADNGSVDNTIQTN